jgi:predicted phage terminase large subunit-like protein
MLFVPPRHGKSELATIRFPVWFLQKDPTRRVIVGGYNASLAARFSRKAREIANGKLAISDDRNAANDWETDEGGGLRSAGVGTGVTGFGADLIVIDDPVKSREEAESSVYREKVWDWYTNDLYTRLEPNGAIILIMTRWHHEDLAGKILASPDGGNWAQITLPALADKDDPLGREIGEALCEARYSRTQLENTRDRVLGSYAFEAMYQQNPSPREGNMFKHDWIRYVDRVPDGAIKVRHWDLAASTTGDYTVGVLMAKVDEKYYIEHVCRFRATPGERDTLIKATTIADGYDVQVSIEQEGGSGGKAQVETIMRQLVGYAVDPLRESSNKVLRADGIAAQMEIGQVSLVRGEWNRDFIDELMAFPVGTHDDQVDGASGAFRRLSRMETELLFV